MQRAALFFEDYLYDGPDGKLMFSPTQSPENTPRDSDSQATFNATMDVAVAKELLRNTIAASRELGCNADKIPVWEKLLARMPDYMIDGNGAIKEWLTPKLENNDAHRHSSQLYALLDDMPEEISASPPLREAFRKSIETKLDQHWRNDHRCVMSFGLVQLGQAAASLDDGDLAYECLKRLVNRFWLGNLASMHNQRSLFNMDISGGLPAVVIKMLVASKPGRIMLLPALPKAWPVGTLEGILCRGEIWIDRLHWDSNRVEVKLHSDQQQVITLVLPAPIDRITDTKGQPTCVATRAPNERTISLPASRDVSLEILLQSPGPWRPKTE
jgi:alpha-L-fucosidase 2